MQFQHTSTLPRTHTLRPWITAAGSAALLAAVAVGAWRSGDHRARTTPSVTQQRADVSSVPSAAVPSSEVLSTTQQAPTIYIVGSADQAAQVTDTLRAGDQLLAQFGRSPFTAQVVIAASPEDEEFIARANTDADAIRAGMGLPPLTVINLRAR